MSLRGNRHGLCYTLGSTRDGGGEKIRKEGNNFDFIFPFSSILLFYLFSVLQAQAVEVFPQQRLGTNSVNV